MRVETVLQTSESACPRARWQLLFRTFDCELSTVDWSARSRGAAESAHAELARLVAAKPAWTGVTIVALRSVDAGFDAHLVKTVELAVLQGLITNAVRR